MSAPLRVGLLGLGTVGYGVYHHLLARPDQFEIAAVGVRRLNKFRDGIPGKLLTDAAGVLDSRAEVIVEAIGGEEPAATILARAIELGKHVVTANKTVIAEHGPRLAARAADRHVQLRYSATVGGGVPIIETVQRLREKDEIRSVSGVLNGTCNFVLDRLIEGVTFADAVRTAQDRGFAEPDPTDDVRGTDAARKLAVLSQVAFDVALAPDDIECEGIDRLDPADVLKAREAGRVYRLVASCERTSTGVRARVKPVELPRTHPLALCRDEENCAVIQPVNGPAVTLCGKGAGRWPTAGSVLGDLIEISNLVSTQPSPVKQTRRLYEVRNSVALV